MLYIMGTGYGLQIEKVINKFASSTCASKQEINQTIPDN